MNGLEKEHGHTRVGLYVQAMAKWLAVALVTGVCCGVVGSLFHIGVERATELREQHPWLLWCLPAAGLVIVAFYKLTKTEGQGTNDIIDAVHHGKPLSIWLLPAIFLGTILTHLCGGSAGREGAALQMGGTVGQCMGRVFHLDDKDLRVATLAGIIGRHAGNLFNLDDRDLRTATMAGMAAFFSALFGTPLTATVFAIVVISIGVVYHVAFIPCLTASLVAYWISVELGVAPTRFSVAAPELEKLMLLRVAVLGVGCALVSVLLCRTLHFAEHQMKKRLPNAWLRVLVGGGAVIALTYLCGTRDYNGAGMDLITAAVEQGTARPEAFLLKILFTAVTLSAGFKGGEVVPSFFVGATFGCVAGPLLGIPAGFAAALGLAAVFCGATNCPLASIFLSVELFGDGGLLYFALICGISYMLSGYNGLYSSQTIVYSKLKAQYINVRTNAYHAGEPVPPFQQGGGEETERD